MIERPNRLVKSAIGVLGLALAAMFAWQWNPGESAGPTVSRAPSPALPDTADSTGEALAAYSGRLNLLEQQLAQRDERIEALINRLGEPAEPAASPPLTLDALGELTDRVTEQVLSQLPGPQAGSVDSPGPGTGAPEPAYPVSRHHGTVRADGRLWITPIRGPGPLVAPIGEGRLLADGLGSGSEAINQGLDELEARFVVDPENPDGQRVTQSADGTDLPPVIPVYTIPKNATLMRSRAMTALIGRVPVRGSVRNPIPFKILTGAHNLAANDIFIDGIDKAIWSGTAIGDGTLHCVRGTVHSVTFVFADGRIRTVSRPATDTEPGAGLGWISDARGFACLPGQYVSNAPKVMSQLFIAGAASGYAEAFSQSQLSTVLNDRGLSSGLSDADNVNDYALGQGLGGGFGEWARYVRERADDLFDAVVVQPGEELAIHVTHAIPIDYDPVGRKVAYEVAHRGAGGLD